MDKEAKLILENVAAATDKNYSRLLILEMVIREDNLTVKETSFDWLMMTFGNGMESEFTALMIKTNADLHRQGQRNNGND